MTVVTSEKGKIPVHKLVRSTAVGMAHALYDELMRDNSWYAKWKKANPGLRAGHLEKLWVREAWPTLIEQAKATLTSMLTMETTSEHVKEEIYDALIKDNALREGKIRTVLTQ